MINKKSKLEQEVVSLTGVIQSILWAMLGVQKAKNHKRDFTKGKASHYIIVGVIMTLIFVMVLLGTVQLALEYLK